MLHMSGGVWNTTHNLPCQKQLFDSGTGTNCGIGTEGIVHKNTCLQCTAHNRTQNIGCVTGKMHNCVTHCSHRHQTHSTVISMSVVSFLFCNTHCKQLRNATGSAKASTLKDLSDVHTPLSCVSLTCPSGQ